MFETNFSVANWQPILQGNYILISKLEDPCFLTTEVLTNVIKFRMYFNYWNLSCRALVRDYAAQAVMV